MAKAKTPKGKLVNEAIEFNLTETEKANKAMQAAKLSKELEEVREERKETVGKYNEKIKSTETKITNLLKEIDKGTELRGVECTAVKNYDTGMMEYWFEGEVRKTRELTYNERQMDIEEIQKSGKGSGATLKPKGRKADPEVQQVMKSESNAKTKWSQTDGART